MNIFVWVKMLGHGFISSQVLHALNHNLSAQGKLNLAASLTTAATDLSAGNSAGAADAITDVLLSIH